MPDRISYFALLIFGFFLPVPSVSCAENKYNDFSTIPNSQFTLYHFVRSAAYLQSDAAKLKFRDPSGTSMSNAFTHTVGLSDDDASAVLMVALELDAKFADMDKQAGQVIAMAKSSRSKSSLLPPIPPELANLQKQKDALKLQLSSILMNRLSAPAVTAISRHLNRAGNLTVPKSAPTGSVR